MVFLAGFSLCLFGTLFMSWLLSLGWNGSAKKFKVIYFIINLALAVFASLMINSILGGKYIDEEDIIRAVIIVCVQNVGVPFISYMILRPIVIKHVRKELKAQRDSINKAREDSMRSGEWKFPSDVFYKKCQEQGINRINSDFEITKAKLILISILKSNQVPEDIHDKFIKNMKQYFSEGNQMIKDYEAAVVEGTPIGEELVSIHLAEQVKDLSGCGKRKRIYRLMIESLESIAYKDIKTESFKMKKEVDPYIAGGIGSAIGGIGGGIGAALSAESQNTEIREYNRAMTMANAQMYGFQKAQQEQALERISFYSKKISDAETKVVFEKPSKQEICEKAHVKVTNITKTEGGILKLEIKALFQARANAPSNVRQVVDGTLHFEVVSENVKIGDAWVILPWDGADIGVTCELVAYCKKAMRGNATYTAKWVQDSNLWVMEY